MRSLRRLVVADEHHEVVGPPLEGVEVVVGDTEGPGDDRERQRHGELLHQLHAAIVDEGVDQAVGDVADRVLDLADRGGEKARFTRLRWRVWAGGRRPAAPRTRPPIRLPARRPRISSDSSDSSASSRPSFDDGVRPGRHLRAERLGIPDDLDDVAVTGDQVDAGLLHEVHRRLGAQLGEGRVRAADGVRIEVEQRPVVVGDGQRPAPPVVSGLSCGPIFHSAARRSQLAMRGG